MGNKNNTFMSIWVMSGDSDNIWIHLVNKYFVKTFFAQPIMKVIQGQFGFAQSNLKWKIMVKELKVT